MEIIETSDRKDWFANLYVGGITMQYTNCEIYIGLEWFRFDKRRSKLHS